ncbi:SDR family NAD(P)-dependent oxidoreductase [Actinoallomurus sp. CA-150999]|uniref:SDR family NAD(P)-dependent oxidoreductase n=1 Tax=Actinoallomurus sp. CA-150999 TaxID=3239887 RepID=UPI003D92BC08
MTTLGLEGRIALVTGGTRGLGLATARRLCAAGCEVSLVYARSDADAEAAVASLSGLKGSAHTVKADVSDARQVRSAVERVADRHGRLDILVHNASSLHPTQVTSPDLDGIRRDGSVVVDPLLHVAPLLPQVMGGGPGRVVAVSSAGGTRVVPGHVGLGMAKAALESLVRYLAVELAPLGISANAVSTAKLDKGPGTTVPEAARMLARRTPAGRLTRPEDVADVIALLCTDEAAWIQGQVITVDGGLALRP